MPLSTGFYSNEPAPMPTFRLSPQQQYGSFQEAPSGTLRAAPPPPIPDVFNRYQPPAITQAPDPPPQPQVTQAPAPPPAQSGQTAPGAAAMAQAALLLQLLQMGPGGFYGRVGGPTPQAASSFGLLTDPSVQGLFQQQNTWKPSMLGAQVQGFDPMQYRQQYGYRPVVGGSSLAPNPDSYAQAVTFLRGLLGLA